MGNGWTGSRRDQENVEPVSRGQLMHRRGGKPTDRGWRRVCVTSNVIKTGACLLAQRFFVESLTSALLFSWSSATGFTFLLLLLAHQWCTGQRKWPCWRNQGEFVW